ncbi:uncharacterized protein LOC133187913 [Saccostrea echinata]|uniref:uncharacterized protein LOC133187913 n=1 Tax=Saccostrea echinata TaxID=191078 RepID=UPI002A80E5DA|nr:uncharacterized protein LOC133187913 [Saccostrea echinata]
MLGAVFGGALFGSIITVVCFMIFRRRTAEQKKRGMALDAPQNIADMRVMEQLVQGHSNKNRMTSNEIKNEMTKSQKESTQFNTEEGVYNHLNATETIDRDEYYDHARADAPFKTQSDTNSDDYDHAGPVPSTASQYDGYGV